MLAVLAHPDDESYGMGGTLARYAREGVDVHVAIATDGAAGSIDPGGTGIAPAWPRLEPRSYGGHPISWASNCIS